MTLPWLAQVDWVQMECGECGILFCVPDGWHRERKERGTGWTCPNGHGRVYRETDVQRLKRELAAKEEQLRFEQERVARAERQLTSARGQLTRVKNRVRNGVCPCCNRTFQNLMRHMASQHPGWKGQEVGT